MLPKVLIVEDEPGLREMYSIKLKLAGFRVASAENGLIGLQEVDKFAPEIVLLDLMMPVMSGMEFMQEIQTRPVPLPHVIVFSNISATEEINKALGLGAHAFWTKSDYTPDQLSKKLITLWQTKFGEAAVA